MMAEEFQLAMSFNEDLVYTIDQLQKTFCNKCNLTK